MRITCLFITTILTLAGHQVLRAQTVTSQEPPPVHSALPAAPEPQISGATQVSAASPLSATANVDPEQEPSQIPRATLLPPAEPAERAVIESDEPQTRHDDVYAASGNVVVTYGDRTLRADAVSYNQDTGEVTLTGHVHITGGENDESMQASRGTYNLKTQTGRFYDVSGSVGLSGRSPRPGYVTSNPFLFAGRMVVKTGPTDYVVYDGSVTSCLLPKPDWQLFSKKFTIDADKAHASNSTFKILGIPALFLPYVTAPVDPNQRQSGILIPEISYTPNTKGLVIGEQIYYVINRSADLTIGSIYYSKRGFSENATFRYRGLENDFLTFHLTALQDRGFYSLVSVTDATTGVTSDLNVYTNQGGEDITTGFRKDFSPTLRAVGDAEYLSSYVFREAFTESFNQAVSSDILSTVFLAHQKDGYSADIRADRYQGEKVVPTYTVPGEEVKIFHAPSIDFDAMDHPIAGTPLLWSLTSSAAGLKRVQPNFVSDGITERLDVRPELSLPLAFNGWHTMSSVSVRETFYSRSRKGGPYGPNAVPVELTDAVNRASVEVNVDIRPPVLERTFSVPAKYTWLLGDEVRHTIEPEITYRDVHGVSNFLSLLRFDDIDLVSDTDELEYGVTQHLYFRPRPRTAKAKKDQPVTPLCTVASTGKTAAMPAGYDATAANATRVDATDAANQAETEDLQNPAPQSSIDANGIPNASTDVPDSPTRTHPRHAAPCTPVVAPQQEWFSWRLAQKYFFDDNFGGAVIANRRNIFDTTLDLSGIAFLTEARNIAPLISRMRFRSSSHTDVEWDFDYDTGANKFNSQNIFMDAHEGLVFGGISYARLNAPGRNQTLNITTDTRSGSATSNFSQMRVLLGYGAPTRPGLSVATSAGLDLNAGSGQDQSGVAQYITIQSSYNWNCCGLAIEYRKYDLGSVRNEGTYSFNFTLANIGTAGNLRRAQALF